MATSSDINTSTIDSNYPVAGQDNDSQGFRDNFANIVSAIDNAKSAIGTLENNSPDVTTDNDFNDNTASKIILQDSAWKAPSAEVVGDSTYNIDYTSGHYRRIIVTQNCTFTVSNWSPSDGAGHLLLEIRNADASGPFDINFDTPGGAGSILTDSSNLDLSSDFTMTDTDAKFMFEVWSPDQGANVFVYYKGAFK